MTVYTLSLYFFSIWALFFGFFVFVKRRDSIGRSWFTFVIFAGMWGLSWGAMLDNRIPYEEALYVGRFSVAMASMIPVTWLIFCHTFLKIPVPAWIARGLLSFSIVYAAMTLLTGWVIDRMVPYQQFIHHVHPGQIHFMFVINFFVFVSYGFFLVIKRFIVSKPGKEREVLGYFIAGMGFGFAGGSPTFLCVYGIEVPMHFLYFVNLFPFFLASSLMNQRLLDVEELTLLTHESKLAMLGLLSSGVLHDIKNPLYLVKNLALSKADRYGEEIGAAFKKIDDHATRAIETMELFRHFAVGNGTADERGTDYEVLMDNVSELLAAPLADKNIQLCRTRRKEPTRLAADRKRLEHVFMNLLQNACEASPVGGTIEISTEEEKERLTVHITDSGSGIPVKDRPQIFEPFYSTKLGQGGSGLGLFIAKHLVELEGGRISLASDSTRGATFSVTLKRAPIDSK